MTNTSEDERPVCVRCGHTADDHPFKHPFQTDGETDMSWLNKNRDVARKVKQAAAIPSMPFDPVLRQALIDKGILTVQDLRDAEEKIRAVTSMMMGGEPNDGSRSDGVRRSAGTDSAETS
jgi:hypothetical protein